MPRCPKGRCRRWLDTQREFSEHVRLHRRPIRRPQPTIHTCQNCGRKMPTPFSHYNRCP